MLLILSLLGLPWRVRRKLTVRKVLVRHGISAAGEATMARLTGGSSSAIDKLKDSP